MVKSNSNRTKVTNCGSKVPTGTAPPDLTFVTKYL